MAENPEGKQVVFASRIVEEGACVVVVRFWRAFRASFYALKSLSLLDIMAESARVSITMNAIDIMTKTNAKPFFSLT